MRGIEGRVSDLEAVLAPLPDNPENWTDSELLAKLRVLFASDPGRNWEAELGPVAGGAVIQDLLAQARAAATPPECPQNALDVAADVPGAEVV